MAVKKKTQAAEEVFQDRILIDITSQETELGTPEITRICWITGEEKNCLSCYYSKGCKAK
jgi:hypothetical protein